MADGNGKTEPDAYDDFVTKLLATKHAKSGPPVPAGTGPVLPNLKQQRPAGLHNRAPNLDKGEHIVFCYLTAALDTLNGIATHAEAPIDIRQRAAEIIVQASTTFLKSPAAVGKKRGSAAAQSVPVQRPIVQEAVAEDPPDTIPPGWGEEGEAQEAILVPPAPAPLVPEPPPNLNIDGNAAQIARIESCIVRNLAKHKNLTINKLRPCVKGYRNQVLADIHEVVAGMINKGKIVKRGDPGNHFNTIYHLPTSDVAALPPDRARKVERF